MITLNKASLLSAALLAVGVLLLATPSGAFAAEIRGGAGATVAPGETIDDDLFAGAARP